MKIQNKMLDILIALSSLVLIAFCSACEKKIETRNKPEYGQNAVTITDDIDEYKGYTKHHDNYNMEQQRETLDRKKADFDRSMKIRRGLDDGSLVEKYSGK